MKKMRFWTLLLSLSLLLTSCGKSESVTPGVTDKNSGESAVVSQEENSSVGNTDSSSESAVSQSPVSFTETDGDMFTNRDQNTDYSESAAVKITFNGSSISCDSNLVEINGTTVTIKGEGDFLISGALTEGQLVVNAGEKDKPHLIFDNVNISSATSAALYIIESDKVTVTLVGENTLTSGEEFVAIDENNIDGAVYSKQDLSFNGDGSLSVNSPAGHGIVCKDDLVFVGGTVNVTSASHGIDANDSVRVKDTVMNIASGKDGIHAENNEDTSLGFIYISNLTADITAEGDGLSAGNYLRIENGVFNIITGGGSENGAKQSSDNWGMMGGGMEMPGGMQGGVPGGRGDKGGMGGRPGAITNLNIANMTDITGETTTSETESTSIKGIKADNNILINGGTFNIDSADDSIHSNLSVEIKGGSFTIESGDDAIHAEDTLTVSGGTFDIKESYEGLEALNIKINGGDIKLVSSDDGVNAAGGTDQSGAGGRDMMFGGMGGRGNMGGMSMGNGSIVIDGGNIYMNASGDGIDANGYLEINGGYIVVCGPTQGDTAVLDYDTTAEINGGTFIGTGASMMAQTFTGGSQGVIALSVGNQQAGTKITVTDSEGNEIINESPELSYQIMIVSSPEIIKGDAYEISVGSLGGTFNAQ